MTTSSSGRALPSGDVALQPDTDCYPDAAMDQLGWYCINSADQAQPTALKPANGWGLHDMHGNLSEWCNDLYGPLGYGEGPLLDPVGHVTGAKDVTSNQDYIFRVLGSGNHVFPARSARSSAHGSAFDGESASNLGFRLARTIPAGASAAGEGAR